MITKEQFLEDTTEEELFSLIHEALLRLNEERDTYQGLREADIDIGIVAEQMIKQIKNAEYLGRKV